MIANKKFQILTISILVAFVIFSAVLFFSSKPTFTGFATYGSILSPCGATMTESSTFDADKTCLTGNGLTISCNSCTLDCLGHSFSGAGVGEGQTGLIIQGTGVTIQNCIMSGWWLDLNVSGSCINGGGNTITDISSKCSAGAVTDTTSPVVHSILPENNKKTNETTQNLSCSITDNLGISNLTLYIWNSSGYLNYSNTATLNGTANSTNWTRTLSTNDAYIWNCLGYDNSTNNNLAWSLDGNYTLTIDTISPNITIISPLNQTYNTTVISFNASLNESGSWCGYSLDGFENVSMAFNASNTGASAINSTMSQGSHSVKFSCNDTAGNMNATSSKIYFTINSGPTIDFGLKTTAVGNYSQTWIAVNVTSNDTDLDKITIYIYNQTVLHNSTFSSQSSFFANFTNLAEGTYYINATANDSINNLNVTSTKKIILDRTAPTPTLTCTPTSVAPNEVVTCTCSATDSLSGVDTSTYVYTASPPTNLAGTLNTECYVNDTAGNNGSTSTSYTVTGGGGGGGGGGGCTPSCSGKVCGDNGCGGSCGTCSANQTCSSGQCVTTLLDITCTENWTCGNWTACISGIKTQTCTDTNLCTSETKTETQACEIVTKAEEIPETTEPPARHFFGFLANDTTKIPKPSDIIPHGDVPAIVVDTAVYTTAVAAVIGGFQLAWLWILGLLIPLFMLRLRHYCVAIIDMNAELPFINHSAKILKSGTALKENTIDREKLSQFLKNLELALNDKIKLCSYTKNSYFFIFEKSNGFMEIQTDLPVIINAHFSDQKHANRYRAALKNALKKTTNYTRLKSEIMITKELSSKIALLRNYLRDRKTRKTMESFIKSRQKNKVKQFNLDKKLISAITNRTIEETDYMGEKTYSANFDLSRLFHNLSKEEKFGASQELINKLTKKLEKGMREAIWYIGFDIIDDKIYERFIFDKSPGILNIILADKVEIQGLFGLKETAERFRKAGIYALNRL